MRGTRLILPFLALAAASVAVGTAVLEGHPSAANANVPAQDPVAVRLLLVGDNHGDNPVYRRILTAAARGRYDLLVNLADTSEDGTPEEFAAVRSLEASLPFPVLHVVGSHDIAADPSRAAFEAAFNQRYLSRDVGPVHLVLLDNADRTVGFDAAELEWLASDLAANRGSTTLVFYHRSFGLPFSEYTGDDETAASRATNERLLAVLRRYPVAHVYSSHLHTYLPYTLDLGEGVSVPATVSGGGGDPAQAVLGGPSRSFFHALEVTVTAGGAVQERVLPAPSA